MEFESSRWVIHVPAVSVVVVVELLLMLRFILLVMCGLAACNPPENEHLDHRSEASENWTRVDQKNDGSGFTRKSHGHLYGSPYVLITEFKIDLDSASQYAILDQQFTHRCGDDADVTFEFALVMESGELTAARQIQGVTAFADNPGGIVTLQAIVFSNRFCQIPEFNFTVIKAAFSPMTPKQECEEQAGMKWDGHACVKGPELLCKEKENYLFIDDECVPRTTDSPPSDLLNTTWKQILVDDQVQWIFQFNEDGEGVFGFADGELSVKSGTVELSTDFEIEESHVILRVVETESLPDSSRWKAGTFHYCRFNLTTDEEFIEPTKMQMSCGDPNRTELPELTSSLLEYELIDSDDADFSQD